MGDDPNIPLQRREDQGRADPEFTGTVESLSHENKHIILETEDDALIECTSRPSYPPRGVKNVTYIFGVPLCRVSGPGL